MGSQHSKKKPNKSRKSVRSLRSRRGSGSTDESLALSADSLDLIYIDDYFDDARYLKRLKQKEAAKKHGEKPTKTSASDSVLASKRDYKRSTKSVPTIPTRASSKNLQPPSTKTSTTLASNFATTPKKQVTIETDAPSTDVVPPTSVSTGDLPPPSTDETEKATKTSVSWHGEVPSEKPNETSSAPTDTASSGEYPQQGTQTLYPSLPTITVDDASTPPATTSGQQRPRSILTAKKSRESGSSRSSTAVKKHRSVELKSTAANRSSLDPPRTQSVDANWSPAQTRPRTYSTEKPQDKTADSSNGEKKKSSKLVVRGLRNFVNSHKRDTYDSFGGGSSFSGGGVGIGRGEGIGGPAIWKREFPSKSKFHPDNYIYDWGEGPNAPPRPYSAMAKCKKHGGRCNDCGLFTCDLCQSCRKCENDCACPCLTRGSKSPYINPFSQGEAYQEIFGGDGWSKARKVLCDLTENEKKSPVGGNASKKKQNCEENWAKNNFYKSQIDVLNPYNIPLTEAPPPGVVPQQQFFQPPMCMPPPMFPMPFMPIMAMPPPMMPYYPPPPMCSSYDPCYIPPPQQCPYPPSDSFMPIQNY